MEVSLPPVPRPYSPYATLPPVETRCARAGWQGEEAGTPPGGGGVEPRAADALLVLWREKLRRQPCASSLPAPSCPQSQICGGEGVTWWVFCSRTHTN